MKNYRFIIYYQRGDKFEYIAPTELAAFQILWEAHPEYRAFDLLKVEKKEYDG